jgi:methyl-accepting chemotaxis protein
MARGITQALQNLVNVAEEVKEGDINLRTVVSRHDEVGKLAEDINVMLDTISNSRRDLQEIVDYSPNIIHVKDPDGRFILSIESLRHPCGPKRRICSVRRFMISFPKILPMK